MNYFFKHLFSFFCIGIVATIIFIFYLKTTTYSGGEIGMTPFLIAIYSLIVIGITSVVTVILKFIGIKISILKSSILFSIIYLLLLIFYFESNPFKTNQYLGDVNLWMFLSEILSATILNIALVIRRQYEQ